MLVAIVAVGIALRLWRLGFNGLTFDESFTATGRAAARRRLARVPAHRRLAPAARLPAAGAAWLAPARPTSSSDCRRWCSRSRRWCCSRSWMRDRGRAGADRDGARCRQLLPDPLRRRGADVRAARAPRGRRPRCSRERWLRRPARWHVALLAVIVRVALFDHVSGFLLAAGLFAVAGVRGDRAGVGVARRASWPRAWCGRWSGAATFAAPSGRRLGGDWIPRTSLGSLARAVSRPGDRRGVARPRGLRRCPRRRVDRVGVAIASLGRVWVAVRRRPVRAGGGDRAGVAVPRRPGRHGGIVGTGARARLPGRVRRGALARRSAPRSSSARSWSSLAGTVDVPRRRSGTTATSPSAHLDAVVRPGDTILTRPARYATLPGYRIGVERWGDARSVSVAGIPNSTGIRVGVRADRRDGSGCSRR